jgi:hypothetical protein
MLLSLLNSHATCTSAHSGTCMNGGAHNLKASEPRGTRDSNPSAGTVLTSINAELDSGAPLSICVGGCISGGIWIAGGSSPGDAVSTKSSRDKPPEAFPERDPIRKVELSPSCGGNDRDRDPGPLRFPLPWVVAWCGVGGGE